MIGFDPERPIRSIISGAVLVGGIALASVGFAELLGDFVALWQQQCTYAESTDCPYIPESQRPAFPSGLPEAVGGLVVAGIGLIINPDVLRRD